MRYIFTFMEDKLPADVEVKEYQHTRYLPTGSEVVVTGKIANVFGYQFDTDGTSNERFESFRFDEEEAKQLWPMFKALGANCVSQLEIQGINHSDVGLENPTWR